MFVLVSIPETRLTRLLDLELPVSRHFVPFFAIVLLILLFIGCSVVIKDHCHSSAANRRRKQ